MFTWSHPAQYSAVSIHAPREGSDLAPLVQHVPTGVSIHAPGEGSDLQSVAIAVFYHVSIHAPGEGSDTKRRIACTSPRFFQSTLPAKGATCTAGSQPSSPASFNPRSPRRERLLNPATSKYIIVSIHAPREGSDEGSGGPRMIRFNPCSPRRERPDGAGPLSPARRFNPRSRRRERPWINAGPVSPSTSFQSTLPARGATFVVP